MRHRQFLIQIIAACVAILAPIPGAAACSIPLPSPVGSVVRQLSALPVGTFFASKVLTEPFQPTLISTESFCRFTWTHFSGAPANLARIGDAVTLTAFRAMPSMYHLGRRARESLVTSKTNFCHSLSFSSSPTRVGAKNLLAKLRWPSAEFDSALLATFRGHVCTIPLGRG